MKNNEIDVKVFIRNILVNIFLFLGLIFKHLLALDGWIGLNHRQSGLSPFFRAVEVSSRDRLYRHHPPCVLQQGT